MNHKGEERELMTKRLPNVLLNVAYKIYANALQHKLQPLLVEVIIEGQYAFHPMRYIPYGIFPTNESI